MSSSHERTTNEFIRTNDVTLTRTNDDQTHPNEERTDELQKSKNINKKNKKSCWQLVWEEKKSQQKKREKPDLL